MHVSMLTTIALLTLCELAPDAEGLSSPGKRLRDTPSKLMSGVETIPVKGGGAVVVVEGLLDSFYFVFEVSVNM